MILWRCRDRFDTDLCGSLGVLDRQMSRAVVQIMKQTWPRLPLMEGLFESVRNDARIKNLTYPPTGSLTGEAP